MRNIGERIKQLRSLNNDKQVDLAKKLKFHKSHLSKIESGYTEPSVDTLERISIIYDVKMSYFFGEEKDIEELNEHVEWVAFGKEMEGKELTPEQIKEMVEFAETVRKLSREK